MSATLWITLIILFLNTAFAVIYFLNGVRHNDIHRKRGALVILVCPGVAVAYFFFADVVLFRLMKKNEMDIDDITFKRDQVKKIQLLNYEEEVLAVPIEEALLVANESDRRQSLLNKLKKDYDNNIGAIMKAVENEDGETAHYAASVILNVNGTYLANLRDLAAEYDRTPDDLTFIQGYSNYLLQYINSGLLSPIERSKYGHLFLGLFRRMQEIDLEQVAISDYQNAIDLALEMRDGSLAMQISAQCVARYAEDEGAYLSKMKVYYSLNMPNEFHQAFQELRTSDIFLSEKGLDIMRLFGKPPIPAQVAAKEEEDSLLISV